MDSHLIYHFTKTMQGTSGYNLYQIITLTVGMLVWTYLYVLLAYRGFKFKFVQMPIALACGNIVWEFLWGFIFQSQYELGMIIGAGSAFLIDLTIFIGILKYSPKHISNDYLKKNLIWICMLGIIIWGSIWVTFKTQGMDTDGGGTSGNILNALIAAFWCAQLFTIKDINLMSVRLGWAKLFADIPIALFMMSVFPTMHFSWMITWIAVFFDIVYIYLYYSRKKHTGPFHKLIFPNE